MIPIISICIPTYNRAKNLRQTLESIVRQDDFRDIQIIISDNCSNDDTFDVAAEYVDRFPLNIRYSRNDKNINDANFEKVLSLGDGRFLKLHNDTAIFKDGALRKMINVVTRGTVEGYIPFFMNGNGNSEGLAGNLGAFINKTKYWNTWIGAFGIWKKDFDFARKIMLEKSDTKLTQSWVWFSLVSKGRSVFVDNETLFDVAVVPKKGGYNVAQVFGMNYNRVLDRFCLSGCLPIPIYKAAKRDILDFVNKHYFDVRNRFSFEKTGYFKWMLPFYWRNYYFYIKLIGIFVSVLKNDMKGFVNRFVDIFCSKKRRLYKARKRFWKKLHPDSAVRIENIVSLEEDFLRTITVGKHTYGSIIVRCFGSPDENLSIGNCVSMANVEFMLGGNHQMSVFSTFPFKVRLLGEKSEALTKGPIIVEDDVWIGDGVLVLSGVKIGKGSVIAARSVVTKDVPPYSVVGGNPARFIKWRFSEEIRQRLMRFDFSRVTPAWAKENRGLIYAKLTNENVEDILQRLESAL